MNNDEVDVSCKCARCRAIAGGLTPQEADAQQAAWQAKCLEEKGFFVHYVGGDSESPTGFNAHTHGLEFIDHLNFQLVVPLEPLAGHTVLSTLAERVKSGEKFVANQLVNGILHNYPIKLVEAAEDSRKVLRVILPDPSGKVEPEEINEQYSQQYKGVEGVTLPSKPKAPWIAYKPKKNRK